jgi:hypothetical protein
VEKHPLSNYEIPHQTLWRFPFAFAALNFAHRSFVAFEIFALAAADITRFFTAFSSGLVESPKAFAAARIAAKGANSCVVARTSPSVPDIRGFLLCGPRLERKKPECNGV